MITLQPVHWETATLLSRVTYILDFGTGDTSGLGVLSHHNKDHTGVGTNIAGTFKGTGSEVGYKPNLFHRFSEHIVKYAVNWPKEHRSKLV